MSDPFSDIDNEVTLDKLKKLFHKYKKPFSIFLICILLVSITLFYISNSKKAKDTRLSGYLIEILSIINTEDERAINELEKLSKLGHVGHEILSNLLLSKIYLKNQDFQGAINHLLKIEIKSKKLNPIKQLKNYFISVAYLGVNNKQEFQKSINLLISHGGYWALLGHELRGHFLFGQGNFIEARKDFNKIINEQLATQTLRARAQEMLKTINLNDEVNS